MNQVRNYVLLIKTKKMNEKTPKNPKGAGRKKYIGKRYPVICHPKVIVDVRKYAKEKSEEEFKKDKEL